MAFGIIYKVTNKVNGKVYIGQTTECLTIRKKKHYASRNYYAKMNRHFSHALRKYKRSDFLWEIIDKCDSKEELDEMEFHYIMSYDSYNNGYNMTFGGEGIIGHKHTEESKLKMSLAKKGKPGHMAGFKFSKESKAKMSESAKNRVMSPRTLEHCKKISEAKMGHKVSEEAKRKISEGLKCYYRNKKLTERSK
jgi:group I intron endonuclease